LTKCNLQKLITDGLNKLLMLLPENMIIMHKLNRYKKYIKQPIPLKNIEHIKYKYCVTPKFDGIRAQMYITNENKVYIITNNFQKIIPTNIIPKKSLDIRDTIIDGELINNRIFYAFDIILYKNNILKNTCLLERLNILKYDISFKNNPNV